MNYTVYSLTGEKKGTQALSEALFGAKLQKGLMHQAFVMQQSNRRQSPAHAKTRGEVVGSTKKVYQQKHTGRARRGPIRSPTVRGGGKAFGPRNERNFTKRMPKEMRHAAIRACLSFQAKREGIMGLDAFPETIKTKQVHGFLSKIPVELGRRILFVLPGAHKALQYSARNIPGVMTVDAAYLNPEQILLARNVIFVGDAIARAEAIFAVKQGKKTADAPVAEAAEKPAKKVAAKKPAAKKKSSSSTK